MALQAVFLDVGNTLVRERPSRFEIYAQSARSHGLVLETARMIELMQLAHRELPREIGGAYRYSDAWFEAYVERIFAHHLGLARSVVPGLLEALFTRFSAPETFELFPGALELLDDLRARGLRIGIVSNWSPRLPRILDALDVSRRVDFTLCSAIERLEKPDAQIFERALQHAGARADTALHAGDHYEKDVLGARRVGLRAVLVDHADAASPKSAPRVRSLVELHEYVARLCA